MSPLRPSAPVRRLWLGAALAASCATAPAPRPTPPVSAPAAVAVSQPPPPSGVEPPAPRVEPPASPGPRLPWVNPARCLPACAFDPGPQLVRVNRLGQRDERGRLRLLAETQEALRGLLGAAEQAGHKLRLESAFRSYDEQARLFSAIQEAGRAARPGHSEHQLGSTADLRLPTGAALEWLAEHAADFGFALSYPAGKQRLTGYRPEPWHVRFVGRDLAEELRRRGLTLEELFRERPALGESGSCEDCPLPASRTACGAVTSAGQCQGTVLSWCYDGALATVDCAVSQERCGAAEATGQAGEAPLHRCLPAAP